MKWVRKLFYLPVLIFAITLPLKVKVQAQEMNRTRTVHTQIAFTIAILGVFLVFVIIQLHKKQKQILLEEQQKAVLEEKVAEISSLNEQLKENFDIISNAGYGIWRIKLLSDGRKMMFASEKLLDIFGIKDKNLSGEDLYQYYHSRLEDSVTDIENDDYMSMMDGNIRSRMLTWKHPYKGNIYLLAGGTSYVEEDGKKIISGYCGDITDQKISEDRMNLRLAEAKRQAEAASNAKTAFLFNMSHDIRTPMNAIMGFTELLEHNIDDKEKCLDYLSKIRNSSSFLLSLINNVLEVSRIESGRVTLNECICKTGEVGKEIQAVFSERMRQKNINFYAYGDVKTKYFYADEVKLKEIYLNLISNAYKYTPAGGTIKMYVAERPCDREGYTILEATISDTGIGMSEEFLPKIFEEFTRAKTVTEDRIEGTGLGMPIVKRLVDLMGGTISITSELGKGTTVVVSIPHRIADSDEVKSDKDISLDISEFAGKRILLAEDNDLNAEIAIALLEEVGFVIERAADGVICVDMLQKAAPGYYDLILMDIQMPNMDGYKATEIIRTMKDDNKKSIPIIAMTANAFDEDRRNAFKAGMNAHISKPISVEKIVSTISNVTGGQSLLSH